MQLGRCYGVIGGVTRRRRLETENLGQFFIKCRDESLSLTHSLTLRRFYSSLHYYYYRRSRIDSLRRNSRLVLYIYVWNYFTECLVLTRSLARQNYNSTSFRLFEVKWKTLSTNTISDFTWELISICVWEKSCFFFFIFAHIAYLNFKQWSPKRELTFSREAFGLPLEKLPHIINANTETRDRL